MTTAAAPLLEITGITKFYGSQAVLEDCRLDVQRGEIHALIGGNGAGKSTLVRIIAGLVRPTAGAMKLDGRLYAPKQKRDAESAGVEIVQQEFNLIPTLSVAENLLLTRLPAWGGIIRRRTLHRRAQAALDRLGLQSIPTDAIVETLGVGQQQMVEIAAALDRQCKLLILDEPTAALSAAESETLFQWLEKLRNQGTGILYISHRLDEIARLSNRITTLRDGRWISTEAAANLTTDQMIERMTGDAPLPPGHLHAADGANGNREHSEQPAYRAQAALRVEGLTGGIVRAVSFQVHCGERLGIAGLVGSGRTELLRLIFGAETARSGWVYLGSQPTPRRFSHPRDAVKAGIAMVTEDRKHNGLLLSQSIRVNATLAAMGKRFSRWGLVRTRTEIASTEEQCHAMDVRCSSIEQTTETLSGGNQQKVVIARWLNTEANVFLFDEPTRGIDVPARKRIYELMDSLAAAGKGLVIVSSDLEELFETCDRIAVMSNGSLVKTVARSQFSHDLIMQAAFSGYRDRSTTP